MKKWGCFILAAMLLLLCSACFADTVLPPYTYTGSDPVEEAAAVYSLGMRERFQPEEDVVTIPAPVILKTVESEDGHVTVYANLWIFNYKLDGTVLECVSGGEAAGILKLAKADSGYTVESWEEAGDGDEYSKDIERFSAGDTALRDAYNATTDMMEDPAEGIRTRFIQDYVTANALPVDAYKDYGWDPVALVPGKTEIATGDQLFVNLADRDFIFSSGVGAWSTILIMDTDGNFTGEYHDSDMGDMEETYPNGTVYRCAFHGRFTEPVKVDDLTWTLKITGLEQDKQQENEEIVDGIRYVASEPYGLGNDMTVTVYLPGTSVKNLPEALIPWTHINEINPKAETLPFFVLWNEEAESGFVGED